MTLFRHVISSDALEIEAPIERVWDILLHTGRYGEWNPFTTRVETTFEIGSPVVLCVKLGPIRLRQPERIEAVEPPRLLVWSTKVGHPLLVAARREQRLDDLGAGRCRYVTTDVFTGVLTPLVVLLFGRLIRRGFNDMARALKRRAELVSGG